MKQLIQLLLILVLCSCEEPPSVIESIEAEDLTSTQIDSILTDFKFQYETPIVLDSTDQVLIPISTSLLNPRKVSSKNGYYSDDYPRYWNVLFYNRKTGETRLLSEDKIRISDIHDLAKKYHQGFKVRNKMIFYEINDIDFNKDKKLNSKDPGFLFSSNINGTNLKRVSPENEDLQYFELIPKSTQILIKTLRDTNQDSIFNRADEFIWYKAALENSEWIREEIIDSTMRDKIEKLYFDQWLKKK